MKMSKRTKSMTESSKKGQITIFIILGIVLLAGASFMFYLNSKNAEKVEQKTSLNTDKIENYIKTCIDNSLKKNLLLIGDQGGLLYKSQNGPYDDFDKKFKGQLYVEYEGKNLPFLIAEPFGSDGYYFSKPDKYPWIRFPYTQAGTKSYIGYFGINYLSPLNKPLKRSIQEEIETASLADIRNCDIKIFDAEYDIRSEEPSVEVIFANSTIMHVYYAISVSERKTGAKKEFKNFTSMIPVNFARMYSFTSMIAQQDVQNLTFNMSIATTNNFIVAIKENASKKDDVITIQDRLGKIDGKPYAFKFARKNRNPALEFLNLTLNEGQSITAIAPKAIDPDEDSIAYTYFVNGTLISDPVGRVITDGDCANGHFNMMVNATDGQLHDSQEIPSSMIILRCS